MARMPTEHDLGPVEGFAHRELHAAEDTLRRLMHPHHHDAPQPAAAPAVPHNETQEPREVPPMSLADDFASLENHFKGGEALLQNFDREAIAEYSAVKANPEAAAILSVLASVAKAELPAGMLSAATSGLQVLQHFAAPAPQSVASDAVPAPQPAGPVVAGQA